MPETLQTGDEQRLLSAIKQAVDLVDNHGLSPDDAIEKVARQEKFASGMIGVVARAYNNGRQLAQWQANSSILDKLASFPLADPERIVARIYPKNGAAPVKAAAALDHDYFLPPLWHPDARRLQAAQRDLGPLLKAAAASCPRCGQTKCVCPPGAKKAADCPCPHCGKDPCVCPKAAAEKCPECGQADCVCAGAADGRSPLGVSRLFTGEPAVDAPVSKSGAAKEAHYPGCGMGKKRRKKKAADAEDVIEELEDEDEEEEGEKEAHYPGCGSGKKRRKKKAAAPQDPAWLMRQAYGNWERAKNAHEQARRHQSELEDKLRVKVAELTAYFRQANYHRKPFAEVEFACRRHHGPASVDLLKIAYDRSFLREKRAMSDAELAACKRPPQAYTQPFRPDREPYTTVAAAMKLARDILQARQWVKEAAELRDRIAAETLRPFGQPSSSPAAHPRPTSSGNLLDGRVKAGLFGGALQGAIGGALTRGLGGVPKSKADLSEDQWLDLEDPQHQNELRKIRANTALASMLTDPDDPISGHDPDKVISAYNEISATAPRVADNMATLKPILRKRLAGHTEPFEAKELVDIEKGLRDVSNVPPSTFKMTEAPESVLG